MKVTNHDKGCRHNGFTTLSLQCLLSINDPPFPAAAPYHSPQLDLQPHLRDKPLSKLKTPNFHALSESNVVLIRVQRFVFLSYFRAAIGPLVHPLTPYLDSSHAPGGIWPNLQPPLLREPWHGLTCRALSSPRQTSAVPLRPLRPPATRPKRTMVHSTAATHGTARRAGTARAHAVQTF